MSQSALLRRLLRYVKPYGLLLGMALVFALLQVAMTLSAPVIIGQAVDVDKKSPPVSQRWDQVLFNQPLQLVKRDWRPWINLL